MIPLKFKKLYEDAKLPVKGTEHAACFDFFVHRIEQPTKDTAILYFGLATEFSPEYVMTLQPRSSFSHKGWEQSNSPGQVDADFRGELQVRLQAIPADIDQRTKENFNYPKLPYKIGDRCTQGKLEHVVPVSIEEVTELSDTTRGTGGFGSTGK